VTGASSGIGRETAILLSELGSRVVLTGRDGNRIESTRARMKGEGHVVELFDLSALDAIPGWIRSITARTGPLYGLVHCAGIHKMNSLPGISVAHITTLLQSNLSPSIMLLKAWRQRGCSIAGGSAVLLGSAAALKGEPGLSIYSATKAALTAFVRSIALEIAPDGTRVNCVAPGCVETEMLDRVQKSLTEEQCSALLQQHPLGFGKPRDVAHSIVFLLSDAGRWITGTTLVVDGGYSAH
jgi:NAD(P)-dependent dehydrogenase (short-subunit alcohol dehydrogenase family)